MSSAMAKRASKGGLVSPRFASSSRRRNLHVGGNFDTGNRFWGGSSGRWAGEQMLKALKKKEFPNPSHLRTLDTLQKDEWKAFDDALIPEATIRLRAVADLIAAGLTIKLANAMGKTVLEYEKVTDMDPAIVSMDGMTRSENDRMEFSLSGLPIPITHKDFFINLRTLTASRIRGEALDTMQSRTSGRLIGEETERMLVQGGNTYGGLPIYGYMTHPNRNTAGFGTNGAWHQSAKTGDNILTDIFTMMSALEVDRMFGPYMIYVPRDASIKLANDFKAASDKTISSRILEIDGIAGIKALDQLPTANVLMVQMSSDTVVMVDGEPFQTIQWDVNGGFGINF